MPLAFVYNRCIKNEIQLVNCLQLLFDICCAAEDNTGSACVWDDVTKIIFQYFYGMLFYFLVFCEIAFLKCLLSFSLCFGIETSVLLQYQHSTTVVSVGIVLTIQVHLILCIATPGEQYDQMKYFKLLYLRYDCQFMATEPSLTSSPVHMRPLIKHYVLKHHSCPTRKSLCFTLSKCLQ